MKTTAALHDGRQAFRSRAWADAYARLSDAGSSTRFQPLDLEWLAISAYLSGNEEQSEDAWARAHQAYLRAGDVPRAVRCAFWLVMQLLSVRESARASGWLATAQHLLDDLGAECAEHELLCVVDVRRHLRDGNVAAAQEASRRSAELSAHFADPDLRSFALLVQGLIEASQHRFDGANACLDQLMVAVSLDDVSPIAVGIVYCAAIEACYQMADLGRAREWTETLARWCEGQPDLVAFRGHCAIHRAQTMRFCGAWPDAMAEAARVCRSRGGDDSVTPAWRGLPIGAACYEIAEIHRMQGEFEKADQAYRDASSHGRSPEPGVALLRLAQGRHKIAEASIRRALETPRPPSAHAFVLAASVEVSLAVRDVDAARHSAEQLAALAAEMPATLLRALSAQALGAVLLAQEDGQNALSRLREAWMAWQSLDVPYEAARARLLMALACRIFGDLEGAAMECAAARRVFERLGAAPDLARVDEILGSRSASPLTPREIDVMKLVASGRTNRAIARSLRISERTVDRHVSNILVKLDLPSRAAATAYAYEHGLV